MDPLVQRESTQANRCDQRLGARVSWHRRARYGVLPCSNRSSERPDQAAQLPRRVCLDATAAGRSPRMVGPPRGRDAGRRSAQQCDGLAPALRTHRGACTLGRSQLGIGRHDQDLRAPWQPQSAGGISGANSAVGVRCLDPLAGLGGTLLCSCCPGVGSNGHHVQLQPRGLAGHARGPWCAGPAARAACHPQLAKTMATSRPHRPAGAGWYGLGDRGHAGGSHPYAGRQPPGWTRR